MALLLVGRSVDPKWVQLTDLAGTLLIDGEFLVPAITSEVRRAWTKKHGFCTKCSGLGFIPLGGDNAIRCTRCHDNPQAPSMDKPEVQVALAEEICLGWRGVPVAAGGEFEFTPENRSKLIEQFPEVFWALMRAGDANAQGAAKLQGKA